jgi:hypothetical protein
LGIGAQAPPDANTSQAVGSHTNKYGKLRSTTHEQRLAAAARRAALIKQVKARHEADGTLAPAQNGVKPPTNHKTGTTK